MKRNILLVYPPMDDCYYHVGVNDSPPLGLVALHNFALRNLNGKVNIEIIDGENNDKESILSLLGKNKYDLVGLQPMMASYRNSLEIIKRAKEEGSTTIFGGHHATQLAGNIIKNQRHILDYIVSGDGEDAFLKLIKGENPKTINNLAYWHDGGVIINENKNINIDQSKILYFDNRLLNQYKMGEYERGSAKSFRAFSHKGCNNRLNSQYCFFCGRADRGFRLKSPDIYLQEIDYLVTICNAMYIFDIGDDFLQDKEWLKNIVELKKNRYPHINPKMKIFARANRIDHETVELMKKLNITEVAIGFESGSDRILRNISKYTTAKQNLDAARLLFSNKIDTIASYVLGLPGEDSDSLEETYTQAMRVRDLAVRYLGSIPQEIIGNIIEINPGSPAFNILAKAYPEKYEVKDILDIKETQNDYFKLFFSVKPSENINKLRINLAQYCYKINILGKYTYPAGLLKDDMNEFEKLENI